MSSPESRGAKTLDDIDIMLIAIWSFVGSAVLFAIMGLCCCCCVSISPSSPNPHPKLTYISLIQCGGTSKNESSDFPNPEVPLDDLESVWPRSPESVLRADSVETLPRYTAVDDPPKYARSVASASRWSRPFVCLTGTCGRAGVGLGVFVTDIRSTVFCGRFCWLRCMILYLFFYQIFFIALSLFSVVLYTSK